MATVYLDHDLKPDRDVAIKVLHADLGAALGSDRFLSEIRTSGPGSSALSRPPLNLADEGRSGGARRWPAGNVTRYDYIMTMKDKPEKTVKVAELKAHLSAYLRAARRGHPVTVCERDTPVARLVPYAASGDPLTTRQPIRGLHEVSLPPPLGRRVDSLAALLEERQSSR